MVPIGRYTKEEKAFFVNQVQALYPEMYRFVKGHLDTQEQSAAQDIVQTACQKAWESFHQLKKRESFRAWIFSILCNVLNEYYRRSSREQDFMFFSEDPEQALIKDRQSLASYLTSELVSQKELVEALIDEEDRRRLMEAFDLLEEPDQKLLKQWMFSGCSEKDLAEMAGINYNTFRSRIHRVLSKLREHYHELERRGSG